MANPRFHRQDYGSENPMPKKPKDLNQLKSEFNDLFTVVKEKFFTLKGQAFTWFSQTNQSLNTRKSLKELEHLQKRPQSPF